MSVERAAAHYDQVTETWMADIMGEDLHFGLFSSPRQTLAEATHAMTVLLAGEAEIAPGHEVLDLGCGVGTQAMYLSEHERCRVTGISTSRAGLDIARARADERGLADGVCFELQDAMNSGLPEASFDRVFSLESAHLMEDKAALFRECHRVLRPGGRLALCDVVLVGDEGVELSQYVTFGHSSAVASQMRAAVHATMHRAFGSSRLTHTSIYEAAARDAGFSNIRVQDISAATRRTLERWGENAARHRDRIVARLGEDYLREFFLALLHMSFGWGRLGGYVILTGTKPSG